MTCRTLTLLLLARFVLPCSVDGQGGATGAMVQLSLRYAF